MFEPSGVEVVEKEDLKNVMRCNYITSIELFASLGADKSKVVQHCLESERQSCLRRTGSNFLPHRDDEDYKTIFGELFEEAVLKVNQKPNFNKGA